jgi:hypothetical protein
MARNTHHNHRMGSVKNRTQCKGVDGQWNKRDASTGQFLGRKTSSQDSYKGVAKERDGRRK